MKASYTFSRFCIAMHNVMEVPGYELGNILGKGTFSWCIHAFKPEISRRVALKLFNISNLEKRGEEHTDELFPEHFTTNIPTQL